MKRIVAIILFVLCALALARYHSTNEYPLSISDALQINAPISGDRIYEFGDMDGPYRHLGGLVAAPGQPFVFSVTVNGKKQVWSAPPDKMTEYTMELFENRKGNGFAVVYKKKIVIQ